MVILRSFPRVASALVALAALGIAAGQPIETRVANPTPAPSSQACPAREICDAALGVALTLPAGWRQAAPGRYAPGELALEIPAAAGQPANNLRLDIALFGTTTDTDDARAAAAGAAALIRATRTAAPVTRVAVRYGGAPGVLLRGLPGVLLRGLPGNGPVTAVILAHTGKVYKVLAPGADLAADQRQALASLHFLDAPSAAPAADPCAAPLPVDYQANGGGPALRVTELRGGLNRFELVQVAGSAVGRFTFASGSQAYLGPAHVFQRGATRRVCLIGQAALEREQGGHEYGPARIVAVRLDGTFVGATGRVTLTVGRAVYYVYGTTSTR